MSRNSQGLDDELDNLLKEQERMSSGIPQQQQPQINFTAAQLQNFVATPGAFIEPFPMQSRSVHSRAQQRTSVPQQQQQQQQQIIDTSFMFQQTMNTPRMQQQQPQQHQQYVQQPQQQSIHALRIFLQSLPIDQQTQATEALKSLQSNQITRQTFSRRMIDLLGNEGFERMLLAIRSTSQQKPTQTQQQPQQQIQIQQPQAVQRVQPHSQPTTAQKRKLQQESSPPPKRGSTQDQQKALPPGFLPQQSASTSSLTSSTTQAKDVDVTKMDTSSLQDVINYAGVDLKAESELILRDVENVTSKSARHGRSGGSSIESYRDETKTQTLIQPVVALTALIRKSAKASGLSQVDSDCDSFVALATQTFLKTILERCVQVSKSRVEVGRDAWELELLDGERALLGAKMGDKEFMRSRIGAAKRPLVWLEKFEKVRESSLAIDYFRGSVSEEGRLAMLDAGIGDEPAEEDQQGAVASGGAPSPIDAAPVKPSKKKGKQQPQSASESYWKDRDDLVIRTRLSNAAALQAVGLDAQSKYSWMTQGAGSLGSASAIAGDLSGAAASAQKDEGSLSMGGFGLPRPAKRKKILSQRRILVTDLFFVLRNSTSRSIKQFYRIHSK